jgi:ATP-binding protein involved in chromosome partitioning
LIIDLPPGTSDSPLTIMQVLELDGFIIVTTPQKIAAINSIRSGLMAKRLNVPIIGIIENMSNEEISEYTKDVMKNLDTNLLGCIAFNKKFNDYSDSGKIPVIEDSEISKLFEKIIENMIS